MKTLSFTCLWLLLFFTAVHGQEEIILRGEKKKDLVRIVLEGPEEIIFNGKIKKGQDTIMVSFGDSSITVKPKEVPAAYQVRGNLVYFYVGEFQQVTPFFLKDPARLVIDVQAKQRETRPDSLSMLGIIIIDPGHGGYDTGLVKGEQKENEVVLQIANQLQSILAQNGANVYLTRQDNLFLPLEERAKFAKKKRGHVFLSLHVGVENALILYVPEIVRYEPEDIKPYLVNVGQEPFLQKTMLLSESLKEAINETNKELEVIVRPVPYTILSKIEGAALIIELPSFDKTDYTDEFIETINSAIKEGLYLYETN
ncbi:MAG TPA: N-acetylmuramoyl-L-alanine amidase [Thermodesulfovibrionia bacterium]|nr:N-acetylmuramoyl-L-alanine amidase [Thermodesulfovibrionia bacterium]